MALGSVKLETVGCSGRMVGEVGGKVLGMLCYRTATKSGFNKEESLAIVATPLVVDTFMVVVEAISKQTLVEKKPKTEYIRIFASPYSCFVYYLDLIKVNLDVSLIQLFDVNSKCGINSLNSIKT